MSIREYLEGEHKAGFIGLRVVVNISGTYKQKYYSFKKLSEEQITKKRAEAESINNEWNMQRKLAVFKNNKDSKERRRTSSAFKTGVSGIKLKFIVNNKANNPKKYYTPVFVVDGSEKSVKFCTHMNILTLGYDMAWIKAVEYYAEKKGIHSTSHLHRRKPPVEQLLVAKKHQESLGHVIPNRRMPKEIPQELYDPEYKKSLSDKKNLSKDHQLKQMFKDTETT